MGDTGQPYARPREGFRFKFGGIKTNSAPDSLPPDKYAYVQNIRAISDNSVQVRAGLVQLFATFASPVTDINSYSALNTDNLPRFLARTANDDIWLDTGVAVGALSGSGTTPNAAMIPFRPAQSPNPWMYIANGADYQKFSAPSATNVVTQQKVGIAEPPAPPDAALTGQAVSFVGEPAGGPSWTAAGTASGVALGARISDSVIKVFTDPAVKSVSTLQVGSSAGSPGSVASVLLTSGGGGYSAAPSIGFSGGGGSGATAYAQMELLHGSGTLIIVRIVVTNPGSGYTTPPTVTITGGGGSATAVAYLGTGGGTASSSYQRQMAIVISSNLYLVQDVFSPIPANIAILGIYYFTGTTGRCIIVPSNMQNSAGSTEASINEATLVSSLRRGALVSVGNEICYVLSVSTGPSGTISIETTTTNPHTTSDTLAGIPGIQIIGGAGIAATTPITSPDTTFATATGIGTVTGTLSLNPFSLGGEAFRDEDYLHFSINVDNLSNLNEIKLLWDVGDGSFTQNFYYYTVRPSDIVAGIANTLTQLGAAQLVSQRATIDEENAAAARNQQQTSSGAQTAPGSSQWSEIVFPISALTRVGNDLTRSLQTTDKVQLLVNASGTVNIAFNSITIFGGNDTDVGYSGAPYLYRVRPRSSLTGVKGNPSPAMRYGVNPRRASVAVAMPSAGYDSQIDTWDIFRYGGTVTSWRKIGQMASAAAYPYFTDTYGDEAALAGEELEFDNLEPWPSIDIPLNVASVNVVGTTAVVPIPGTTNVLRYLPGNLVQIGTINTYTLQRRPTSLGGGNYLFQFVENAGAQTGVPLSIYEPQLARQFLPYMWGADAAGTVFACGDPLRPGTLYFAKNYAPDAAPDSYNIEITPPSEPLMGGEILDGLSFAASTERWWALYPQASNPLQRYSVIQQPITRGLAAPSGHCNDGRNIYWWAKDGIYASDKGSLTDADLYNIFPHEGVAGKDHTYNGNTVFAPDYSRAGGFRLAYRNGYLFALYQNTSGVYCQLTLDVRRGAWVPDTGNAMSAVYAASQQEGTVLTESATYPMMVMGGSAGSVYRPLPRQNDTIQGPIPAIISTMEWDGGDIRAGEQWGDMWLDCIPNALGVPVTATPMAFGAPVAGVTPTVVTPPSSSRVQTPVSLGGEVLSDFLGMQVTWTDDFSVIQTAATSIEIWQPSFVPKPETIADRFTDWYDGGTEQAKYVQGFLLHADTSNAVKGIAARDGDGLNTHAFTPAVQHNGESIKAYSFNTPFVAHTMRLEPTDLTPWRFFDVDWIFEATPEGAQTWKTQGTAFGLLGYMHIKQVSACYAANASVTLAITSFDGQSPAPITLPSTGGAMQKITFIVTANKGQLFFFAATSAQPFRMFLDAWEIWVGGWQRQDNYLRYRSLGAPTGDQARV